MPVFVYQGDDIRIYPDWSLWAIPGQAYELEAAPDDRWEAAPSEGEAPPVTSVEESHQAPDFMVDPGLDSDPAPAPTTDDTVADSAPPVEATADPVPGPQAPQDGPDAPTPTPADPTPSEPASEAPQTPDASPAPAVPAQEG